MIFLQRLLAVLVGLALFVSAFIFASFLLALAAVAGLGLWGWLWWRTRELRRAMKDREGSREGTVIEGEYRVEREFTRIQDRERR